MLQVPLGVDRCSKTGIYLFSELSFIDRGWKFLSMIFLVGEIIRIGKKAIPNRSYCNLLMSRFEYIHLFLQTCETEKNRVLHRNQINR